MCTSLTLETKDGFHLFGRNMDLEYSFNQSIIYIPRNYKAINKGDNNRETKTKYAILGMGTTFNNYPTFADAMNEKGVACAGLNFPGYAKYSEEIVEGKNNVPVYDFPLWILANFSSLEEVKKELENTVIVDIPIDKKIQNTTMHWMVTDKTGKSIVIENTIDGLKVFDNKVGVLTNSPSFDWHMTNLRQYISMNNNHVNSNKVGEEELTALGVGTGLIGFPGDFTPASRFVRTVYLRNAMMTNAKETADIMGFFHILNNVAMVKGSVMTKDNKIDMTQYTSCMDLENKVYYYNTYDSSQLNAIDMKKEDLNGKEIKIFKYNTTLKINYEN